MLGHSDPVNCLAARCDSVHVLHFLVITLSLVLLTSTYYSGKCDGQPYIMAVKIGNVMWKSNVGFFCGYVHRC